MGQLIERYESNGIEVLALLEDDQVTTTVTYDGDVVFQGDCTRESVELMGAAFNLCQVLANTSTARGVYEGHCN
jgi:hypothetical protein